METALAQLTGDYGSYSPIFEKKVIVENLTAGYWIEAFQVDDRTPIGFVAYGIISGRNQSLSKFKHNYRTRKADPYSKARYSCGHDSS